MPIYRGFEAASSEQTVPTRPRSASVPAKRKIDFEDSGYHSEGADVSSDKSQSSPVDEKRKGRIPTRDTPSPPVGNADDGDVTDLILIIHGIGQEVLVVWQQRIQHTYSQSLACRSV